MRSFRFELLLMVIVILSEPGFAQVAPPSDSLLPASRAPSSHDIAEASTGTFSARVREVNLLFSVSDWRGHFVSNLTPSDIKVLDERTATPIVDLLPAASGCAAESWIADRRKRIGRNCF